MEALAVPTQVTMTVLDAIKPFQADDGHKGTFIILRVAGVDKALALRLINRKVRSWKNWRSTDEDFYRLDEQVPELADKFGGEARVVRTALLDISIIETGIFVFKKILTDEKVGSDMWTYVTKLAGIRIPMMRAKEESTSPWERLANSIKNTMNRELTVREVDVYGVESGVTHRTEKSITARETVELGPVDIDPEPSFEQRQMASGIVEQMLAKARASIVDGKLVGVES